MLLFAVVLSLLSVLRKTQNDHHIFVHVGVGYVKPVDEERNAFINRHSITSNDAARERRVSSDSATQNQKGYIRKKRKLLHHGTFGILLIPIPISVGMPLAES